MSCVDENANDVVVVELLKVESRFEARKVVRGDDDVKAKVDVTRNDSNPSTRVEDEEIKYLMLRCVVPKEFLFKKQSDRFVGKINSVNRVILQRVSYSFSMSTTTPHNK